MATCERCGKGEAEWRCQTCGRVVDMACARPTPEGVFCADHAPTLPGQSVAAEQPTPTGQPAVAGKKKGSKALEELFVTLFALTIGLIGLVYMGDYIISRVLSGITDTTGFSDALKGSGWMIVYGMGGLTALIGFAWLLSRRQPK